MRWPIKMGKLPHGARALMAVSPGMGLAYGIIRRSLPGRIAVTRSMAKYGVHMGAGVAVARQVRQSFWRR